MNLLKQNALKYSESAAYHEAAHYVLCVAQDIPVLELGLRIDSRGSGVSHICCRSTEHEINSSEDRQEAEKSIILLSAGHLAQLKFFPELENMPEVTEIARRKDQIQICALLDQIYGHRCEGWVSAKHKLELMSNSLVEENWSAIETLAKKLWDQPWSPRQQLPPIEAAWSSDAREKWMNAREVKATLAQFGLNPIFSAGA